MQSISFVTLGICRAEASSSSQESHKKSEKCIGRSYPHALDNGPRARDLASIDRASHLLRPHNCDLRGRERLRAAAATQEDRSRQWAGHSTRTIGQFRDVLGIEDLRSGSPGPAAYNVETLSWLYYYIRERRAFVCLQWVGSRATTITLHHEFSESWLTIQSF